MYLLIRATGGIRLTASGPVLVQQPAAAGRVSASWQRRATVQLYRPGRLAFAFITSGGHSGLVLPTWCGPPRPDGRRLASVCRRLLGGAKACVHLWCKLAVDLAAVGVVFRYKSTKR